jgi:hypothetical protein
MRITNPLNFANNASIRFKVFGNYRQFTAHFAGVAILKCGHPILAVGHAPTHFRRLSLM